jgi:hypothetical protein
VVPLPEESDTSPPDPARAYANAITFAGTGNTLILEDGYSFTGTVAAGGSDTLTLGGTTNSAFNASDIGSQYTGFSSFIKNDSSTWTFTGVYDTSSNSITQTHLNQGIIDATANNIILSPGHTLTYAINSPADTAAKLTTTGAVALAGNLNINKAAGVYLPGTSYTLVEGNINAGTTFNSLSVSP